MFNFPLPTILVICTAVLVVACSRQPEPAVPKPVAEASAPAPAASAVPATRIASARLLKSSHARFEGKLPCIDCDELDVRLSLERDELGSNSYILRSVRKGGDSRPYVSSGSWSLTPLRQGDHTVAMLQLDSGRPNGLTHMRVNDDGSLTVVESGDSGIDTSRPAVLQSSGGNLDLHALYVREMEAAGEQAPG